MDESRYRLRGAWAASVPVGTGRNPDSGSLRRFASRLVRARTNAASYGDYLYGNGDDLLGFDLPDIFGSGYAWDISPFTTDGTIRTVLVIPEPGRALLLFGAAMAGLLRRRRPLRPAV